MITKWQLIVVERKILKLIILKIAILNLIKLIDLLHIKIYQIFIKLFNLS